MSNLPRTILEHTTKGDGIMAPGAVVLREIDGPMRWATHFRNDQSGGYHLGHYFADLEEARQDYETRRNRGW